MILGTNRNSFPLFNLYRWGFIFNEGGRYLTLSLCPTYKLPFRLWFGGKTWSFEICWKTWSGIHEHSKSDN